MVYHSVCPKRPTPTHAIRHVFGKTIFFFVVFQGIYDPGQTQQKDGDRGFILLPPQLAVLPRSDAGSDRVEPAPRGKTINQWFITMTARKQLNACLYHRGCHLLTLREQFGPGFYGKENTADRKYFLIPNVKHFYNEDCFFSSFFKINIFLVLKINFFKAINCFACFE